MKPDFLLYGANGYVGSEIARLAVERGFKPMLAGRNTAQILTLAAKLGVEHSIFSLDDSTALDQALKQVPAVLHCAGPYFYTSRQMVDACLRTGKHYLDITGEIPVLQAIAARDADAKSRKVMLLPSVGFDVVPTDCLALHLKQRLPAATHLALGFQFCGPARLPPGTQKTGIEGVARGASRVRREGQLVPFPTQPDQRSVDFGQGPVQVELFPWADVFTAYYTTEIPNISVYALVHPLLRRRMAALQKLAPLLKLAPVRNFFKSKIGPGSTAAQRAASCVDVYGEVQDNQGGKAVARLHGPEGGVVWTSLAALAAMQRVLAGDAPPGFQTPALAYGPDFVLESPGVTREDVP